MIMIQFNVVVGHNGVLYYPSLISASVSTTFPFSHPVADLQISQAGTIHFIPDDIIRIQYKRSDRWIDLFHGRINEINSTFGYKHLFCIGHSEEMSYRFITSDFTGAGSGSGDIISDLISTYLTRITDDGGIATGSTISEFNIARNRKNIMDIVKELESLENFNYIFSIKTDYNSEIFNKASAVWSAVSVVPTTRVTAYETAKNVIRASFSENITDLYNRIWIFGNTYNDDADQYSAFAEDTYSQSLYGIREHITVDRSLNSQSLCEAIAEAIVQRYSMPIVIGDLELSGVDVQVGELLSCRFPSLDVGGQHIDDDFRIQKVIHSISNSGWKTQLNVGELRYSIDELISGLVNKNRVNNLGLIK